MSTDGDRCRRMLENISRRVTANALKNLELSKRLNMLEEMPHNKWKPDKKRRPSA